MIIDKSVSRLCEHVPLRNYADFLGPLKGVAAARRKAAWGSCLMQLTSTDSLKRERDQLFNMTAKHHTFGSFLVSAEFPR